MKIAVALLSVIILIQTFVLVLMNKDLNESVELMVVQEQRIHTLELKVQTLEQASGKMKQVF